MASHWLNAARLVTLILALLVSLASVVKGKRFKARQDRLLDTLPPGSYMNWYRVRIARPEHFRRRFKLLSFEASGLVVNAPHNVRVLADFGQGDKIDRVYAKDALKLEWLGNRRLGSGNMHWFALGADHDRVLISADTGFNAVSSREATADICRMIAPGFQLPSSAVADFALEKNAASLVVLAMFAALAAFALIDGAVLNTHKLLNGRRLIPLLPALAVLALPAYQFMTRKQVPSREALTLSMLLAMAAVLAAIPIAKRADQLLSAGPKDYQYTLSENAHFTPLGRDAPPLALPDVREYWDQFDEGTVHTFRLVHGPLGLWQLDRDELNEKTRAFYRNR